ncbi:MAG TPA: FHA domain-containing protein [Bryobacteraceae bacterium]|nr:FHA domain-containing protein [Bryobacteraceae bacterium]
MQNFGILIATLPDGQKREYALSKTEASIGRAATSDIALRDSKVSRAHTRLECGPEGCWVIDLGSANGTKLNGAPVERARLSPGDVIAVGTTSLRYEEPSESDVDPDMTCIDTDAQLETTLMETAIPNELSETRIPRLAIHSRTKTWEVPLEGDDVTIGRHADNTVVLESQRASRHHARLEQTAAGFILHDLGSDNGTWVRGQKITRHKLDDGDTILIGGNRLLFKAGFSENDLTVVEPKGSAKRPKRPVIVIPGFMGSQLFLGSEKVWPNARQIFKNPQLMKFTEGNPLVPNGLVDEVVIVPNLIKQEQYGRLINYLCESLGYEVGKDLFEFAYDFRQDVRISARRLAQVVEEWGVSQPVTPIAHSMGSLVSRYYVDQLGGEKRVERMILLGGPHFGAPKSIVNLAIDPRVLPFGLLGARIREVLLTYPSVYQLLPEYPCAKDQNGDFVDFLHDPSWLPDGYAPYLKNAAQFRTELKHRVAVPTVCIFGYGLKTLMGVRVERNSAGVCTKVDMSHEDGGDSTVPESSATLEGTEIHPIRQYHGTLHVDNDVRKRLKIELTR